MSDLKSSERILGMMQALAWDDRPEEYFDTLKKHLADFGILLEIEKDPEVFRRRWRDEIWDFVITDIVREDDPAEGDKDMIGVELAVEAAATYTVFVLTYLFNTKEFDALDLPPEAILKSKRIPPSFMAREIRHELRQLGLLLRDDRVFLAAGSASSAVNARHELNTFLSSECRLQVVTVEEALSKADLLVVQRAMRPCAAILVLTTADEPSPGGARRPSDATLVQLGMATGLPNGLRRVIVVQQWGETSDQQAVLPESYRGLPTLRFRDSVGEIHTGLIERLRELRVIV